MHSGFLRAFADVSDELDALVKAKPAGRKVWLARATVWAERWRRSRPLIWAGTLVQGLYTYGCPRVGDAKFTSVLPEAVAFPLRASRRTGWSSSRRNSWATSTREP